MNGYTFDAGALIALDRRDRVVNAMVALVRRNGWRIIIPAGAVAQAMRDPKRQANLSTLLKGENVMVVLSLRDAIKVGRLLADSGTKDTVDAHVAICAARFEQPIVTSDPNDLRRLAPHLELIAI